MFLIFPSYNFGNLIVMPFKSNLETLQMSNRPSKVWNAHKYTTLAYIFMHTFILMHTHIHILMHTRICTYEKSFSHQRNKP